ncbi:MAG: SNF2 helicase associated domain-containing protein [Candidatus Pristimantibacillus sp.]
MSFPLTRRIIKLRCGESSYEGGAAYFGASKVKFTLYNAVQSRYEATVLGDNSYPVTVEIDADGDVEASCICELFLTTNQFCPHIAAVLLNIHERQQNDDAPSRKFPSALFPEDSFSEQAGQLEPRYAVPKDDHLADSMIGLFGYSRPPRPSRHQHVLDARAVLDVEFIIKLFPYGYRKYMFGIELKLGPKRPYIVQKIKEFLMSMERNIPYVFSKHFTYNPNSHSFQPQDDRIIRLLIDIYHNETMYLETSSIYSNHAKTLSGDRMLLIPPVSWESLLALLTNNPAVKLEQDDQLFDGIRIHDEPVPLLFEFDETNPEEFRLDVQGLDKITIMESYGFVLTGGKLLRLPSDQIKRLSELYQMLETAREPQIRIQRAQMESFMEKVIPGLMKLGSVHIAQAVSERIMHTPLKAKLYLDRVKDRLLAGLEFQYGDIVINPLEGTEQKRGTDRILMRDGNQERMILELMEQGEFAKTEGGYIMADEDGEYEFLYHILPQLEKLAGIYATSAVKTRIFTGHVPPKARIEWDERTNWLDFKFDIDGFPESEIRSLLKSLEEKRKYYRLPGGALMPLETAEFQEIIRFMNASGLHNIDIKGITHRLSVVNALHLIDSDRHSNTIKLGKSFRQLLDNMRNPDNLDFNIPSSIEPILRDYQKYGFGWFKTLAHYHFGGILADDMGLGKTLQSIAFILSELNEIRSQRLPAIIVCPASLVYNWRNELRKFAPEIRAIIVDGTKEERNRLLKDVSQVDVVITSYPLLRRDALQYAKQTFHTLILDEAQFFKNHTTQTAQAVKRLEAQYRFALTGTPVENSLDELWSIFNVVFPELFPNLKVFNDLSRETVAKRIRPFLLRRLKSDVLKELPEKIESLQATELLPDQKKLYVAYLAELQQETLKHLNDKDFQKNRIRILAGLTRLRQLCCHPALFVEGYTGSSAKFEQLLDMIEECRSAGKRMLIFSQFTEMLGIIKRELGYQGVPYFYLDGQTPTSERVELCNQFNDGERDIFLISLKAGGTGLNLTGADTVILYDLWWNPAVEQQAADRAHRIGQKKVVQVIRLVTQGTVEDKMYELQQKKKNLIDEVIQPGQEALSSLTEQDIREILMI